MEVGPSTSDVFLALVELTPTKRCTLVTNDVTGALARCFVVEKSETAALVRIVGGLRVAGFNVVKVEWSGRAMSPEAQKRGAFDVVSASTRARASGSIHLDYLETWTVDDLSKRTG